MILQPCAVASIPPFQDYDDDDPEIDFRRKRWTYWAALKKIQKEYQATGKEFNPQNFEDYMKEHYGIQLNLVDGNITDGYRVVDEKKYLVFLLKFQ